MANRPFKIPKDTKGNEYFPVTTTDAIIYSDNEEKKVLTEVIKKDLKDLNSLIIDEENRVLKENERKAAEILRAREEDIRKQNEEDRKANELTRQNSFSNNEAARQKTFNDNESARQNTFIKAESQRETAETIRQEEELKRQKAETIRQENYDKKVDRTDNAPELTSGFAGNLVGRGEATSEEIGFRPSGGLTSVNDGAARIERLRGNTLVWNQKFKGTFELLQNFTMTGNGSEIRYDGTNSDTFFIIDAPLYSTHKYLTLFDIRLENASDTLDFSYMYNTTNSKNEKLVVGRNVMFFSPTQDLANFTWDDAIRTSIASFYLSNFQLIDLTQMFGAGNEPTTIEEFNARKPIGIDEYAYNDGELISTTADEIKSVGFNAWDGQLRSGYLDGDSFTIGDGSGSHTSNFVKVIPRATYYKNKNNLNQTSFYDRNKSFLESKWLNSGEFTIPNDCHFIKVDFPTADADSFCIHLVHTGYRNGEYEPYEEFRRSLPISEIKDSEGNALFPNGLLSAGSVYDEVTATKAIKRIGVVDMGSLEWQYESSNVRFKSDFSQFKVVPGAAAPNAVSSSYQAYTGIEFDSSKTLSNIFRLDNVVPRIYVRNLSYTDPAAFKAAMQGVMLYYELAEPIEVDLPEPLNLDYEVSDFGTEEVISDTPTTPLKADIIYQFNAVDRIRENSLSIGRLSALEQQAVVKNDIVNNLTDGGADKALSAETGKELSDKVENISLNLLDSNEMTFHKEGLSIPSSILQYLGKTPCKFIVSGETNQFIITAQNKDTGSIITLSTVNLIDGEEFVFENPRPELEFINVRLQGISSTDKTKKVNLSIVKSNELLHSLKRIDKISEDVFNAQEKGVFRTRFSCKTSKIFAPITVNGECTFDFLSEVDTSFLLMGVNVATGTNVELAKITLAANETLTLKNPRPDLNLMDFGVNVISTTNRNGYVDVVISKPNYLSDKIEYNTRELSSVKENFSVDEELTFDLSAGLIYTTSVGGVQSTVKTNHDTFISNVYKVAQGDRIILSGKGGDGARLYAITDNSYVVTKLAPVNSEVFNEEIIISEDGYIVINVNSTVTYSVKRKSVKTQSEIMKDVDSANELTFASKDGRYYIKRIYSYRGGTSIKVDCNIAVGDKYTIKLKTTTGGYNVNPRFYGESNDLAALSIIQGTISEYTDYSQKDYSGFSVYFGTKAGTGNVEVEVIIEKHKSFAWHNMFGIQCDCKFDTPSIPYFSKPSDKTYCEYFYALYDDLVSRFPQYVTKVDCDEEVLAEGIERDPILEEQGLPIYMYKFIPAIVPDSSVVTDVDGDNKRLKVYIQTGIHPEYVAIWDTYQMMRLICEEWENDTNLEELRWNVEFYIIPCIAPWCVNNTSRVNQNGVNVNRNAPTINWTYVADDGLNYSGETAADQYETKVMMHYINSIKPHIGIDHHNSYSLNKKAIIYTSCVWQKGVDISSAHISYMTRKWKKNMDIFPSNTEDPISMFGFAGFNTEPNTVGMYICEQGALGYTYESCDAICYRNGVYTPDNPIRNTDEIAFTATDGFIHFILFCCKKF